MKQQVDTLLEEDVLRRATQRAADEGRPLSDLIQDAVEKYLTAVVPGQTHREAAFQLLCERPINLSPEQFRAILEHETWNASGMAPHTRRD